MIFLRPFKPNRSVHCRAECRPYVVFVKSAASDESAPSIMVAQRGAGRRQGREHPRRGKWLSRGGFGAVSMDMIAREAGASRRRSTPTSPARRNCSAPSSDATRETRTPLFSVSELTSLRRPCLPMFWAVVLSNWCCRSTASPCTASTYCGKSLNRFRCSARFPGEPDQTGASVSRSKASCRALPCSVHCHFTTPGSPPSNSSAWCAVIPSYGSCSASKLPADQSKIDDSVEGAVDTFVRAFAPRDAVR